MPQQDIELSDLSFSKLQAIIYENTGISIADGRKSLLISRLRGRLRETNDATFKSYIARVTSDGAELQELINRVTTNKTYCYRTPRIWEHFETTLVPSFIDKKLNRPLRVWSAAASTGEEGYTIAILLDHLRKTNAGLNFSVLGTDVSSRVLQTAQAAKYPETAIAPFRQEKPDHVASAFQILTDGTYQVDKSIAAKVKFKLHNLLEPLRNQAPFDAVFLRNVLIYFTPEDQEKILHNVQSVINPDGILYIGESESLNRLKTGFENISPLVYRPAGPNSVTTK